MKSAMFTTHPGFKSFRRALFNLPDQSQQKEKANRFMDLALAAIHKHFRRWGNASLLPASLLAERPLATAVAAVMQKRSAAYTTVFQSDVHGRTICLQTFYNFIQELVSNEMEQYDPMASVAAQLLLDNALDLRNQDDFDQLRSYMHSKFLPLASHTQFVEAGVKEAKLVSQSDRSEQLRSAYAICRSARVNSVGVLRNMTATQRIEALMRSAQDHFKTHKELRKEDNSYSTTVESIIKSMRKEPFKKDRLGRLKDDAVNNSKNNRAENAIQRRRGVDQTTLTQGLVPYGKLKKTLHLKDLEVELVHRGCTAEEVEPMGIRDRIKRLKALETERVGNNGSADKAFKTLSTAPFTIQSDT